MVMALPDLSPPGAVWSVLEPLPMAEELLPDIGEPEAVLAGAVLLESEDEPIAPAGAGAGAADGALLVEDEESLPDGLLIALELLAVEGSVPSALWQAESASAANTGTSRVVYFMMNPFQ